MRKKNFDSNTLISPPSKPQSRNHTPKAHQGPKIALDHATALKGQYSSGWNPYKRNHSEASKALQDVLHQLASFKGSPSVRLGPQQKGTHFQ